MLALILHVAAMPMPIGSSRPFRWTVLAGMTIRPAATSLRTSSGSSFSRSATKVHLRRRVSGAGMFKLRDWF